MTALSIQPTFPIFTDIDGQPLEDGYIFIGVANLAPIGNPITVYSNAALTTSSAQPIRTRGGYPVISGTPGRLYVNSDYSIQVQNRNGSMVYSAPAATEAFGNLINNASQVVYNPAGTGAVTTTVQAKLRESVSVKDFGAVLDGTTDDSVAVQKAFTYANGTGLRVTFPGDACKLASSISLNNYSNFVVDFGKCAVSYTSTVGVYAYDFTQAGNIEFIGGNHTGTSNLNHFVKTAGSAAAQATTYPTIPNENQWSRQLRFDVDLIAGFDLVFDLGNFTREIWVGGYITGNITALKLTGKVVNLQAMKGTAFYSGIAASQALYIRGDSGDATYRYAEGIFLAECILDTVGTTVDVRDVYFLDLSGAQIKTAAGGIALDITKGVCPLTRDIFVSRVLMQGKMRIGTGLASQFLFEIHGSGLAFSDTADTAIVIEANTKGVTIVGASFSVGTGTPKMFSVGAGCANIVFSALNPDLSTYTTAPTVDATSAAAVKWQDKVVAFSVKQNVLQSLPATTWTKIQLQDEIFDTDNLFDAATNYRFTPNIAGYYQISAQLQINSTTIGLGLDIYKNGVSTGYSINLGISGVLNTVAVLSNLVYLNGTTDYVEMFGYAVSGPINTVTGGTTKFSGVRCGS